MKNINLKFLLSVMTLLSSMTGWSQSVSATWGANSNSAWYTTSNWAGGAFAGIKNIGNPNNYIATFTNAFTATQVGINMNTASLSLGAVSISNTRTTALSIGNSSGVVSVNTLALYGATFNGIANVIVSDSASTTLTLQGTQAGTMGVSLNNTTDNIVLTTGTGGVIISSIISGASKHLTKAGTGSGSLTLSGVNTYTGGTTVSTGSLILGVAGALPATGTVTLGGGTLSSGGFTQSAGPLNMTASSTIALGTGNHSLTFANSSAQSWAASTILTITGWTGTSGSSGTAGKIFVGVGGLTSTQLSQITFTGHTGTPVILSTGELVPPPACISPTFSTQPSAATSCAGAGTASMTATVSGTAPFTFQWMKGSTAINTGGIYTVSTIGATSTLTFSNAATTDSGSYYVVATGCSQNVNSNTALLTVTSSSPAQVSIAASTNSVCTGTSVTFTATPNNGGSTPTYNFNVNGTSVQNGPSATYTTTTLSNGDVVNCIITSSSACASPTTGTSNNITMIISSPVGGTSVSSASTICSSLSFNLSLTGSTGSAVTFQWQSSTDSTNYTNIPGATTSAFSVSETATTFYRCLITCTTSTTNVTSTPVKVTLNSPTNCYCTASSTTVGGVNEYISNVSLGSINNTTSYSTYTDYTAQSTTVTPGNTYTISISNGHYYTGDNFQVWIDWNRNGVFTDAGEAVASGAGATYSASITVPFTASIGTTRMRVRMTSVSTATSCGATTYGEVEDYTINVIPSTITLSDNNQITTQALPQGVMSYPIANALATIANGPATINSMTFSTAAVPTGGYTSSDIAASGFKLYRNTTNSISGATQIGAVSSTKSNGNTTENIVFSTAQTNLAIGTYYYFLTADISVTANIGDTMMVNGLMTANITPGGSAVVSGSTSATGKESVTCSTSAPTGTITVAPSCGSTLLTDTSTPPANTIYYWQSSSNGVSTSNPTSGSYTLLTSGTIYVNALNSSTSCWSSGSLTTGPLVVSNNPVITIAPANQSTSTGGNATFTVTATNATSYIWQVSTDSGASWSTVTNGGIYTNATTASLSLTATPFYINGYQYRVIASNTSCAPSSPSTAATLTITYCTPSVLNCSHPDYISNVTINTLDNNSVCSASGYTAYSASGTQTTSLATGSTYTFTMTGIGAGLHTAAIWIDFNQNGLFTDAGEYFLVSSSMTSGVPVSISIPIPAGASVGSTGMRVRYIYNTTVTSAMSCMTVATSGETEDYTISFCTSPALSSIATQTLCNGQSIDLSTLNPTVTNATTGGSYTWSAIRGGAALSSTLITPAGTSTYWVRYTKNLCYTDDSVSIIVNTHPTASISGASNVCMGATEPYQIVFSGTSPWSYTIDTAGGTISGTTSTNPINFSISPGATKTIRVTVLSDAHCTATYADLDTQIVTVTTNCLITWTGNVSNDWNTASNWNPNFVPNSFSVDVTIPSGTSHNPIIASRDIQVGNLIIDNSQSIVLSGYDLSISKNLTVSATTAATAAHITGTGRLVLNGSSAQTISSYMYVDEMLVHNTAGGVTIGANRPVYIYRGLSLQSGVLTVSAANLASIILQSNNVDTVAWLNDFTSGYTGTITGGGLTVQRQVAVTGTAWQHQVSAPVTSSTATYYSIGQSTYGWTAGRYLIPSSNCSEDSLSYRSAYSTGLYWHESNVTTCVTTGWETVGANDLWVAGQGTSLYLTSGSQISLKGNPGTGNINVTGLTNSNWVDVTPEGHTFNSGWSMLGNPYPSSIDLTTSRLAAGFDAQVQVYEPAGAFAGTYQQYLIGTVTPHLSAWQGFMIHKTTASGTAAWPFYQAERTTSQGANYQFYKDDGINYLTLTVSGNGYADRTTIQFSDRATDGFDPEFDANKFHSNAGQPTLYSNIAGESMWMGINTLGTLTSGTVVPVGFEAGKDGNFTISVTADDLASFDPSTNIYLEDIQNPGNWVNLRSNNTYSFTSKANDDKNRFKLHFAEPSGIADVSANVNIFAVNDNVMVDFSKLPSVDATIQIFNILGQELSNETHHASNTYVKAVPSAEAAYVVVRVKMADGSMIGKKLFITK